MSKTLANLALLGALCIAVCGVASPGFAGPDDGKSLVYLPAPASPASSTPCDRACLNGFVDKYFDALVSHCTCNVPFAPDVKYTENGEVVKPGEGIWKTFTGRGTYRVYLANPATGEAGYYGDINEFKILQGTVALRLKVKERRIAEVEMIVAREQLRPKGGLGLNTAGIMTPKMIDELRSERLCLAGFGFARAGARRRTRHAGTIDRDHGSVFRGLCAKQRFEQRRSPTAAPAGRTDLPPRTIPMGRSWIRRSLPSACSAGVARRKSTGDFSALSPKLATAARWSWMWTKASCWT